MSVTHELRRIRKRLVDGGHLDAEVFERLAADVHDYESARVKDDDLPPMGVVAFLERRCPRLAFAAWAAAREIPLIKAEDICAHAVRDYGPEFFAFGDVEEPVPAGLPVGETLIRLGYLDETTLGSGLALQEAIRERSGMSLLLGSLLVRTNRIRLGAYYQALSVHFDVPATAITDELLEAIDARTVLAKQDR